MPEEQDIEVGDSEESAVDVAISDEKEQGKPIQQPLDLSQKQDIVIKVLHTDLIAGNVRQGLFLYVV